MSMIYTPGSVCYNFDNRILIPENRLVVASVGTPTENSNNTYCLFNIAFNSRDEYLDTTSISPYKFFALKNNMGFFCTQIEFINQSATSSAAATLGTTSTAFVQKTALPTGWSSSAMTFLSRSGVTMPALAANETKRIFPFCVLWASNTLGATIYPSIKFNDASGNVLVRLYGYMVSAWGQSE